MQGPSFRDDAKRVLHAAYEQEAARGGTVTHVDLRAGAEVLGLGPRSLRLVSLVDFMEVVGWVKADPFARDAAADAARRITARGRAVVHEDREPEADMRSAAGDSGF